ncbi:hypothetical protein LCGC14_0410300 [marine sediment metagenome]|uniref:Uncharacterized protein n=1 Tax=marine sediment metagenome TaxID=412755 RepID=A0A0F9VG72_9ZZZZ
MARPDHTQLLSAEWTNERFNNVLDGVQQIIDRLLTSVYIDGYGPLEVPVTRADITKLSLEAFQNLVDQQPTIGAKAELLNEAERLDIPRQVLQGRT